MRFDFEKFHQAKGYEENDPKDETTNDGHRQGNVDANVEHWVEGDAGNDLTPFVTDQGLDRHGDVADGRDADDTDGTSKVAEGVLGAEFGDATQQSNDAHAKVATAKCRRQCEEDFVYFFLVKFVNGHYISWNHQSAQNY